MKHDETYQNRWNELGNWFEHCVLAQSGKMMGNISVLDAVYTVKCGYCSILSNRLWIFHNPIANSFKTNSNKFDMSCCVRFIDLRSELDVRKTSNFTAFFPWQHNDNINGIRIISVSLIKPLTTFGCSQRMSNAEKIAENRIQSTNAPRYIITWATVR